MKKKLNVSVIIPCYNSRDTIERALDSVYKQTTLPLEVVLVDDCGQDNLKSFIDSIKGKYNNSFELNIVIAKKNSGAGTSRNIGWNIAKGDYVAFLDSDDSWLPNKLELQISYFEKNENLVLLGSNHYVETSSGDLIEENLINSNSNSNSNSNFIYINGFRQLIKNRFATSTVILKRNISFRFKDQKRYSEDFLLWNQVVLSGLESIVINSHTCIYHKPMYGASGLSSNMSKMINGEIETYKILYNEKYYSFFKFNFLKIYSYMKYLRRLIKVKIS